MMPGHIRTVPLAFALTFAFALLAGLAPRVPRMPPRATLTPTSVVPPAPYGALPSDRQLAWHEMEMYAFLHFTVNTFTDKEWGYGDESPTTFNPTDFNADRIVEAVAAAGMRGVILTAKHHDGFCLWPTKTTDHSVARGRWKNGRGDVVRELADACKRRGLRFGVYLSPWDRNNAQYGRPEYVQIYRQQLRELLTNYGPIFEVWHDGANGGDGFYGGAREKRTIDRRTYYDWPTTWRLVRALQPNAVIFSDVGPDVRWVGNESGYAGDTNWATYAPVGEDGGAAAPGYVRAKEGQSGHHQATQWLPAECDVSIRPGWFWHERENDRVKTPRALVELYYKSVGRGCNLLLNIPPDRRGQLYETDVASLKRFGELLHETFATNLAATATLTASNVRGRDPAYDPRHLVDNDHDRYSHPAVPNRAPASAEGRGYWATDDDVKTPELVIDFATERTFSVIHLRENIRLGQRVEAFAVDVWQNDAWHEVATGTSIGPSRLLRLDVPQKTTKVRLRIMRSPVALALSDLGIFAEPGEARPNENGPPR